MEYKRLRLEVMIPMLQSPNNDIELNEVVESWAIQLLTK